jgi:hypothetical protein
MANALLSPKVYANAGLKLLKNNLVIAKLVNTDFKNEYKKVGNTVYSKRPPEFVVRDGAVANVQDVVEGEVPIVLDKQKGVDVEFTSVEETLTVDSLLKSKTLDSAMAQLATQVDSDLHALSAKFFNWVGTPAQVVNSYSDLLKAPQRLDEMAVPSDKRFALLNPEAGYAMAGAISALTAQTKEATDALTRAKLPTLGNLDVYITQTTASLTTGTRTGGNVDGANQDVAYSAVKDGSWTQALDVEALGNAKTVKAGEVFTIAGVYAVNPRTKAVQSYLQQFTVIADALANSTAGGQAELTISPPIIASGAFQNVSAAPDNDAPIVWMGDATATNTDAETYRPNLVLHRNAITLVTAKMTMPFSGEADYATDPDTGLTVRYWRSSDSINDTHMHRWDVLYGVKAVDPRLGTRLSGTP